MSIIYKLKGNEGLTLIELMIAMALFVIVMVVVTGLFGQAVNNQSKTTSQKNLQESLDYSLNFIKKEVSGAQQSLVTAPATYCGGATCSGDSFFCTPTRTFSGATVKDLYFINKNEQCVRYFLQTDTSGVTRLAVTRNGLPTPTAYVYLTASDTNMTDLDFDRILLTNDPEYPSAKLTMFFAAKPVGGTTSETFNLQSTVTLNPFVCGQSITDRDNFSYKTVLIGDQCWMAENLKTKTKPDGTCINSGASFVAPLCTKTLSGIEYGGETNSGRDCISSTNTRGTEVDCSIGYTLYRWAAIMDSTPVEGEQGICPNGWHIPTNAEQDTLIQNTGTAPDPYLDAGGALKATGTSGFNAIMTGDRGLDGSTFSSRPDWDSFWTSLGSGGNAHYRYVHSTDSTVVDAVDNKLYSIAVRCIKN